MGKERNKKVAQSPEFWSAWMTKATAEIKKELVDCSEGQIYDALRRSNMNVDEALEKLQKQRMSRMEQGSNFITGIDDKSQVVAGKDEKRNKMEEVRGALLQAGDDESRGESSDASSSMQPSLEDHPPLLSGTSPGHIPTADTGRVVNESRIESLPDDHTATVVSDGADDSPSNVMTSLSIDDSNARVSAGFPTLIGDVSRTEPSETRSIGLSAAESIISSYDARGEAMISDYQNLASIQCDSKVENIRRAAANNVLERPRPPVPLAQRDDVPQLTPDLRSLTGYEGSMVRAPRDFGATGAPREFGATGVTGDFRATRYNSSPWMPRKDGSSLQRQRPSVGVIGDKRVRRQTTQYAGYRQDMEPLLPYNDYQGSPPGVPQYGLPIVKEYQSQSPSSDDHGWWTGNHYQSPPGPGVPQHGQPILNDNRSQPPSSDDKQSDDPRDLSSLQKTEYWNH